MNIHTGCPALLRRDASGQVGPESSSRALRTS
jgi:hypothetical protein